MQAILDRVINVPIQDEDITKTVTSLPRPPDKAGVVGVRLKRKMDLKNAHIESFVRPHMLIEALKTFKSLGNVHYKDVQIDESFLEKPENETPMDTDSDSGNSGSDSDSFDNDDILDAVKIGQAKKDSHTCMVPINPEEDIVVNDCNTTLYKKLKENGRSHEIAPGENKRPSNWCREKDFDVKAFPTLHPTGKYGLYFDRPVQISCQMYFNQRLLNIDDRFAEDMPYLFMAQQFTERRALERQMDISGQRGVVQKNGNSVNVSLKDPFSIFAQVKGTPKYWQKARNELVAKVKVLGPFQVFFTLSCAEMRWSEIFVAILRRKGYKVEYKEDTKGWDGNDDNIRVEGKKLWEFVDSMAESKHELLKNHVFLVTRMFDERVKSFIKNLLMGKGSDNLHIMFYTYRIEMQDRGLPHVHGVAWIDTEWLESEHGIHGNLIDNPEKEVAKLTDKLVSCSINTGDIKLDNIVKEVQKHNHSKSCKKYGTSCRFGFPRLPSRETKIARPLSDNLDPKEKKAKKEKAKEIVEKAKTILESSDLDENLSLEDFIKALNVSDKEYHEAIGIMEKGNQLILKRNVSERFINNYNPEIAKAWDGNTDFQIALDPFAVVTYMVSYVAKDETGMTKFLKEALNATLDKPLKEKLKALKMAYLKNKQMGASEAVYRVLPGMHLKNSNISTIFVQSGFPENRSVHFKRLPDDDFDEEEAIINDEGEDDEECVQSQTSKGKVVKLADKAGNYNQTIPIQERYVIKIVFK